MDYRDLGYVWRRGDYKMDVDGLRRQLTSAKLLLGDVQHEVVKFVQTEHAPIGFVSFDLDYYTSTVAALRVFDAADAGVLPRVICYFDDVTSDGHRLHCDEVGELLAIREFNDQSGGAHTLAPIRILHADLLFPNPWMQQLWVYHRFGHHQYNQYIGG